MSSPGCKACSQVLDCYLVGSAPASTDLSTPILTHTPPTLVHKSTCSCVEGKGVGSVLCFILGIHKQCCKGGLPLVTFSQIKSYSRLLSATANVVATPARLHRACSCSSVWSLTIGIPSHCFPNICAGWETEKTPRASAKGTSYSFSPTCCLLNPLSVVCRAVPVF